MTNKTIFLTSGHTFTFRDVRNVIDNETTISFDYVAMSDGSVKRVVFYKYAGAVGHSTYDDCDFISVEEDVHYVAVNDGVKV